MNGRDHNFTLKLIYKKHCNSNNYCHYSLSSLLNRQEFYMETRNNDSKENCFILIDFLRSFHFLPSILECCINLKGRTANNILKMKSEKHLLISFENKQSL